MRVKRKVQTEDIIKDVKRHSFYLKPGEKKRVKQALAQKRARKKNPYIYGRTAIIGLPFLRCNRFTDASRVANNNAPTPPTAICQSNRLFH
jgi:ribosomal protein S21